MWPIVQGWKTKIRVPVVTYCSFCPYLTEFALLFIVNNINIPFRSHSKWTECKYT